MSVKEDWMSPLRRIKLGLEAFDRAGPLNETGRVDALRLMSKAASDLIEAHLKEYESRGGLEKPTTPTRGST